MVESIFSRTYKYKQTGEKNNLENFLIEIFTYCLQTDYKFRVKVGNLIDLSEAINQWEISSQKTLSNGKRPDVFIETNNTMCLIECKVDAQEGNGQLDSYNEILTEQNEKPFKKLIYLTKYLSSSNYSYDNFTKITWYDINMCINEENNEITRELKKFLIEKKISLMANFNQDDKLALTTITNLIHKMNEVLDAIKTKCNDSYSIKISNTQRASKLQYGGYYDILYLNYNILLDIGFFGLDTENITLGVRLFHPNNSKNHSVAYKIIKSKLDDWEYQKIDLGYWLGKYKLFSNDDSILTSEESIDFIFEKFAKLESKGKELNIFKE